MPHVERELYLPATASLKDPKGLFTRIVLLNSIEHLHRPRFEAMLRTELDQAIFMDGDTFFVLPVPELFETLDTHDLAVALDGAQHLHSSALKKGIYDKLPKVPGAIQEWNTGVLAVRMSEATRSFAQEWSRWFGKCRENGYSMDQAAFRSTLFHSNLRIATPPNNWNFRAQKPQYVVGSVRILHAHGDLAKIATTINLRKEYRLYQPDPSLVYGYKPRDFLNKVGG
jgi:hypothetical protein